MKMERIRREVAISLVLVLTYTICCVAFISLYAVNQLGSIGEDTQTHARAFVPAKRISHDFEREILNARIRFVYFITIQKPGMLEVGWKRYHNAENSLKDLAALSSNNTSLAELRPRVIELQQDLASYDTELNATLSMVQAGETTGPRYDAQLEKFFARGNALTAHANAIQDLAYRLSDADTNTISDNARGSQRTISLLLALSILLCVLATIRRVRMAQRMLARLTDATGPDTTINSSGPHIMQDGAPGLAR